MTTPLVRALVVAVTGMALALAGPVGTAAAAPPERGAVVDGGSSSVLHDYCGSPGLTLLSDLSFDGRFQFGPRGRDGLQYWLDHTRIVEVLTHPGTGEHVRIGSSTTAKDLRITDNGDGTLTVLFMVAGNETVSDAEGTVLARNPGQGRLELLVDHAGTPTDPTDDAVLDATVVKESTGRSDDFCSAIVAALA